MSKNQFELVTASFNNQQEPVSASHSQFGTTSKNQFELVTASFNNEQEQVSASYSQFKQSARTNFSELHPVWTITSCHAERTSLK